MALRDKLRTKVQPFLEPGESIEEVFPAQAASPWMVGLGGGLFIVLLGQPRTIVVTDRAVVVLRQSKASLTPKGVLARLPRNTRIGPVSGLWAKTELNGQRLWIHRRFHKDVTAADAALGNTGAPTAEPHPDDSPTANA